ncbi:alpha/beta-hydrolase [Neolentinus lepideus HHB14362 ss-1]|uniref:Carboxylic ester hydrolase n=1 Tax=Neolentinus lepideus HHB14362 ss-1 TaxID=1314782 RepID=A0A165TGM2_9AGAM|nr:alpha/beta-hydrolase [Neolentinus lepideus HHB14362 ss-1]
MVATVRLLAGFLLLGSTLASPVPSTNGISFPPLPFPPITPTGLLCQLPIVKNFVCPRQTSSGLSVSTPIGTAQGTVDTSGVNRFVVRYATADRWQASAIATTWALPNGATDPSALPLACPQPDVDDSAFSEDCLSMILYVPTNIAAGSNVPTMMWIHGGSFIVGSATGPGLDGSSLAIATNSIIAVVQYRLGALGWMAPSGATNLAMVDLINALGFLRNVVPSFGGDTSHITIAGQSSGANMVRAMLAIPSASSMFNNAIIQSDPMDYGFLSTSTQQTMQTYFNGLLNCSTSDTSCLNAISLDGLIDAQMDLFSNAYTLDPSATQSEPMRPVHDGNLITTTLDSSSAFPSVSKSVLVSTVLNEAGLTIYGNFDSPLPESSWEPVVNQTFGTSRTEMICNSSQYAASQFVSGGGATSNASESTVDARAQLQELGTDYIWKCSSWTFARNWVSNGGTVYAGLYIIGSSYPGNSDVSYCTDTGVVCHQDDIQIVFGTAPSPTSEQAALISEMQARYGAFFRTGNPNPSGSSLANWQAAGTSDVNAILLGGSGHAPVGACDPSYWGDAVQYDYQVYGI